MEIDVLIENDSWESLSFEVLASAAFEATISHTGLDAETVEVSFLACDDARISALNGEFRAKPTATNVLSWPAQDLTAPNPGGKPLPPCAGLDGVIALGDIAIAFETCEREAAEMGKPLDVHVTHLIVHGTLHLLGYDHMRDLDATLMQGIETEILGKMGLDDPYRI